MSDPGRRKDAATPSGERRDQPSVEKMTDKFLPWVFAILAGVGWVWTQFNPRGDIREVETRVMTELSAHQLREDARFVELQHLQDQRLMIVEHLAFKDKVTEDQRRMEEWLRRVSVTSVQKDEALKDNAQMIERVTNVRNELQDLQRQFAGTYNVGKQLDNLQAAVNDLQKRVPSLVPMKP